MEQLSGLDAAFVYFEAAGAAHISFFAIYDPTTAPTGAVGFQDVATHLGSRLGADHLFRSAYPGATRSGPPVLGAGQKL